MVSDQICIDLKLKEVNNQPAIKVSASDSVFADVDNLPPGVQLVRKGKKMFVRGCPSMSGIFICNVSIYEAWPGYGVKHLVLSISVN